MARRAAVIQQSSPLPEADCVEGFLHPRDTKMFFGHEDAKQELFDGFTSGKLHHGWLLSGPSGVGKATLAYRFARYLLADKSEREGGEGVLSTVDEGRATRLIRAQSHPGLLVIRRRYDTKTKRFGATIPVDEVRRVRNFLTHSAGDGAWRVVIVDTADEMNNNAANALLKSLEEPPERTVFLLVTSEPGRLLPTIRSRCRVLHMAPLSGDQLDGACRGAFQAADVSMPAEQDWSKLLELGQGSVGRVLSLYGMGGVDANAEVEALLGRAARPDWRSVHALGDRLAPIAAVPKFNLFFELLLERLSNCVSARACENVGSPHLALGKTLIAEGSIANWAALWEDISRAKSEVAALNLDRKAFVVETVQKLHELARRAS